MEKNRNPHATPYSYQGPAIFMSPAPGICHGFQFGTCNSKDHHRNSDGSLLLHVCQPCLQIRGYPVDHCCTGSHAGHNGGKKYVGALGCPHKMSNLPSISQTSGCVSTTTSGGVVTPTVCQKCKAVKCECIKYSHKPSFYCTCDDCDGFFKTLEMPETEQILTDNIYGEYIDYHIEQGNICENCFESQDSKRNYCEKELGESCYFRQRGSSGYESDSSEYSTTTLESSWSDDNMSTCSSDLSLSSCAQYSRQDFY